MMEQSDGVVGAFLAAERPACPTSLDPPETNVTPPSSFSLEESFRHSGWADQRRRIRTAFRSIDDFPTARLARFNGCGGNAWIMRFGPCGSNFRVKCDRCHDRFCVPCAAARGATMRAQLMAHSEGRTLKMLTLTLRGTGQPLAELLDRINKHFRAFRALPLWKSKVRGGVGIIEAKIGKGGERWHVHLHCLIEAGYVDQKLLSQAWLAVTGDSFVVDIRPVQGAEKGIRYVTKYLSKPFDSTVINKPAFLLEAVKSLRGRRMAATFGSWRGLKLSEHPTPEEESEFATAIWEPIAPLGELLQRASAGDSYARFVLGELRRLPGSLVFSGEHPRDSG